MSASAPREQEKVDALAASLFPSDHPSTRFHSSRFSIQQDSNNMAAALQVITHRFPWFVRDPLVSLVGKVSWSSEGVATRLWL